MRYKLVVFDLDETLWMVHQSVMGPVTGPFQLKNSHEIIGPTAKILLRQGVRRVLSHLDERDCYCSLASRNDPAVSEELLELFGIADYFVHEQYGWQSKGAAVINIIKAIKAEDGVEIEPRDVIFIDDYPVNCDSVREVGAAALLFGRDVNSIEELLELLR